MGNAASTGTVTTKSSSNIPNHDSTTVKAILSKQLTPAGSIFDTLFIDGHTETISFQQVLKLKNGPNAILHFTSREQSSSSEDRRGGISQHPSIASDVKLVGDSAIPKPITFNVSGAVDFSYHPSSKHVTHTSSSQSPQFDNTSEHDELSMQEPTIGGNRLSRFQETNSCRSSPLVQDPAPLMINSRSTPLLEPHSHIPRSPNKNNFVTSEHNFSSGSDILTAMANSKAISSSDSNVDNESFIENRVYALIREKHQTFDESKQFIESDDSQISTRRSARLRHSSKTSSCYSKPSYPISPSIADELRTTPLITSQVNISKQFSTNKKVTKGSKRIISIDSDDSENFEVSESNSDGTEYVDAQASTSSNLSMEETPLRRSVRSTRHQDLLVDPLTREVSNSDSSGSVSSSEGEVVNVTVKRKNEEFLRHSRKSEFAQRHQPFCTSCAEDCRKDDLIYCQGCSSSYHERCVSRAYGKSHVITLVSDKCVLQCRRCVNQQRQRDPKSPDLSMCQVCREVGISCAPFQQTRPNVSEFTQNSSLDHNNNHQCSIDKNLINNPENILFRCTKCLRAYHYHHLPQRSRSKVDEGAKTQADIALSRLQIYKSDWMCVECAKTRERVQCLVAWRPTGLNAKSLTDKRAGEICQDDAEYLVKFEGRSYARVKWRSGAWVWGFTTPVMRNAYFRRGLPPCTSTENAVPEEYLRIDVVLDVKFPDQTVPTYSILKNRMHNISRALVKYQGLDYSDVVWEVIPKPDSGKFWNDFLVAYETFLLTRRTKLPAQGPLVQRLQKVRSRNFNHRWALQDQPKYIGKSPDMKMLPYQLEGLNWIYYRWYLKQNGILADEMGLGKTIQALSFISVMVHRHECYPFLVVVPNSMCPNWRREASKWLQDVCVVSYCGGKVGRELIKRYELFPGNSGLRCHVVVTSYEALVDDDARRCLKNIPWQGVIVDEGQRLKNDRSLIHGALKSFNFPFRLLLSGTPLQNDARELFNLLQFLDEKNDAAALEKKYANIDSKKISELHSLVRPYILRRTKLGALGDVLPPMAQVIVPLSMSPLQKKVYKSILSGQCQILKKLFNRQKLRNNERASLNNIFMQLRKCLCHPFVYSQDIEERDLSPDQLFQNLVEASSKTLFLKQLLPKLIEKGHRVLMFSQFLSMLAIMEDFLEGMNIKYLRLDGNVSSLERQKRVDAFNAPNSQYDAFLLSTRAGGVGINLATADTVIILDPDFNPHQDIQAISRAHRLGQKNKVICLQLMNRASVEEKIVKLGRKKLALDHAVVGAMDAEDLESRVLEGILRYGANELFSEDKGDMDIEFDDEAIEKLLDRSKIVNENVNNEKSFDTRFSFARVWEDAPGKVIKDLDRESDGENEDGNAWERILKERERVAKEIDSQRVETLGRGKRKKTAIDYGIEVSPVVKRMRKAKSRSEKSDLQKSKENYESEVQLESSSDDSDYIEESEVTTQLNKELAELGKFDQPQAEVPNRRRSSIQRASMGEKAREMAKRVRAFKRNTKASSKEAVVTETGNNNSVPLSTGNQSVNGLVTNTLTLPSVVPITTTSVTVPALVSTSVQPTTIPSNLPLPQLTANTSVNESDTQVSAMNPDLTNEVHPRFLRSLETARTRLQSLFPMANLNNSPQASKRKVKPTNNSKFLTASTHQLSTQLPKTATRPQRHPPKSSHLPPISTQVPAPVSSSLPDPDPLPLLLPNLPSTFSPTKIGNTVDAGADNFSSSLPHESGLSNATSTSPVRTNLRKPGKNDAVLPAAVDMDCISFSSIARMPQYTAPQPTLPANARSHNWSFSGYTQSNTFGSVGQCVTVPNYSNSVYTNNSENRNIQTTSVQATSENVQFYSLRPPDRVYMSRMGNQVAHPSQSFGYHSIVQSPSIMNTEQRQFKVTNNVSPITTTNVVLGQRNVANSMRNFGTVNFDSAQVSNAPIGSFGRTNCVPVNYVVNGSTTKGGTNNYCYTPVISSTAITSCPITTGSYPTSNTVRGEGWKGYEELCNYDRSVPITGNAWGMNNANSAEVRLSNYPSNCKN